MYYETVAVSFAHGLHVSIRFSMEIVGVNIHQSLCYQYESQPILNEDIKTKITITVVIIIILACACFIKGAIHDLLFIPISHLLS